MRWPPPMRIRWCSKRRIWCSTSGAGMAASAGSSSVCFESPTCPMRRSMSLYLIAEVGINHNGNLDIAKQLIDAAADAGFDAVKFQKRTIDKVYTKEMLDGPRESPWGATQRDQKMGLEFGREQYREIDRH